jgi:GT2 family glycosyltransferase
MKATIIIPVHDLLQYTIPCYTSILEYTNEIPYKIIFIANTCSSATKAWLMSTGAQIIYNERPFNFAESCNLGFAAIDPDCEYIILLNNDTIVTLNWLKYLVEPFTQDPDIGLIGSTSNRISSRQQIPVTYDPHSWNHLLHGRLQSFSQDELPAKILSGIYPTVATCHRLAGFCLAIRRSLLDTIGPLDTLYAGGNYDDDDLCVRSILWGYKNMIAYRSFVHHHSHVTFNILHTGFLELQDNYSRFWNKWSAIFPPGFQWSVNPDLSFLTLAHCPHDIAYYANKGDTVRVAKLNQRLQELLDRQK